jgi:hypothetical protein
MQSKFGSDNLEVLPHYLDLALSLAYSGNFPSSEDMLTQANWILVKVRDHDQLFCSISLIRSVRLVF